MNGLALLLGFGIIQIGSIVSWFLNMDGRVIKVKIKENGKELTSVPLVYTESNIWTTGVVENGITKTYTVLIDNLPANTKEKYVFDFPADYYAAHGDQQYGSRPAELGAPPASVENAEHTDWFFDRRGSGRAGY